MFTVDLHVHTVKGSSDSSLLTEQLISEASRIGLQGVHLSEHGGGWTEKMIEENFPNTSLNVITGLEVNTDMGHIIAIGMDAHAPGTHNPYVLREAIDKVGGVLISAHPMRNFFNKPPYNTNLLFKDWTHLPQTAEEAATHELFSIVDFIEVTNGANTPEENKFTLEIAKILNKPGTGGSDAHSIQGIGKSCTVFQNEIKSKTDLIKELKSGNFYPAEGLNKLELHEFK
ncbi:MAG: hypothetical protein MK345_04970 [SAR202 cluster bacterium]|nr:hypothetical protein [SAR202 cluster bacterium]|tara:strand:- start:2363 stop:3049 length:687 start_codon:yes stop_codon:yes gene_type:complete